MTNCLRIFLLSLRSFLEGTMGHVGRHRGREYSTSFLIEAHGQRPTRTLLYTRLTLYQDISSSYAAQYSNVFTRELLNSPVKQGTKSKKVRDCLCRIPRETLRGFPHQTKFIDIKQGRGFAPTRRHWVDQAAGSDSLLRCRYSTWRLADLRCWRGHHRGRVVLYTLILLGFCS
jgi:hypothetical protein